MKIPKLKIKKLKKRLERLPKILAERAFLTFFGLFLLFLVLGFIVFYKYSFLIQQKVPEITEMAPRGFNEKIYEEVLKAWQEKEERFQRTDHKEYPNLF